VHSLWIFQQKYEYTAEGFWLKAVRLSAGGLDIHTAVQLWLNGVHFHIFNLQLMKMKICLTLENLACILLLR